MSSNEEELALQKLREATDDYQNYMITRSEACHRLLGLIQQLGVREVLYDLPSDLREEIFEWAKSSPLSDEDWKKQRVFEFRKGYGGFMEAISVPISRQEIMARKSVASSIKKYMSENIT